MDVFLTSSDGIWVLCERLRAERLLVNSEVDSLRNLLVDVENKLLNLGLISWNNKQHQLLLQRLLSSHAIVSPDTACSIATQLNAVQVTEAYRRLGHHHSAISRILSILLGSPRTTAELLHAVDSIQTISSEDAIHSIFSLVYGNGVVPSDEKKLLETLSQLIRVQLVSHSDPRHVIRKGTASFPRLYKLFSEALYAAKIFLTAALHDSVMLVLCQDEIFLDIDPSKALLRFPAAERVRRFGDDPTNSQYHKRVAVHRKMIVEKLVLLAHNFIKGICDSLSCFPPGLIWLVQQLHSTLVEIKGLDAATLICTDLIVTNLLCPAIANPENVGVISDTPISHIARFNLMQIGQIIQTLSLSHHESPPPHFQVFTNQFKESPICGLVPTLLSRPLKSLDSIFPTVLNESNKPREIFHRTHFMASMIEVNTLMAILHSEAPSSISSERVKNEITSLSRRLPHSFSTNGNNEREVVKSNDPSPSHLPRQSRLRNFAGKVHTSLSQSHHSPSRSSNESPQRTSSPQTMPAEYFDVIVFQIEQQHGPLGLTPEDQFMESVKGKETSKKHIIGDGAEKRARFVDTGSTVGSAVSDRTTDNASDLEEEAEQQEVGSISSSMEAPQEDRMLLLDEDGASTLPDNVSDVDVGGMSGRGSPSLSGRDSPLSQAPSQSNRETEGTEHEAADLGAVSTTASASVDVAQRNLPRGVPVAVRKQNAEGLEEKFGKFTVPTSDQNRSYRDDQRSLLSDSWSTNVVPSDDEGPTPPGPALLQLIHLPPGDQSEVSGIPRTGRVVNRTGSLGGGGVVFEDRSDTWSLDAIASDSEADGGRERERQVQDVQDDVHQREQDDVDSSRVTDRLIPVPYVNVQPLIDISPSVDVERMRRQSSGSSFSYTRSEADSEISKDPREERDRGGPISPLLPTKPPIHKSVDQPGPSGMLSMGSPQRSINGAGVCIPDSPRGLGERSVPVMHSVPTVPPRKKFTIIQQGLQKVGDKVRKGMANTSLRQIPHSSTLSDLLGDWNGRRDETQPRLPESHSENRIADMDQRSADDILAKYQRASVITSDVMAPPLEMAPPVPIEEYVEQTPYYSSDNLTQCRAFLDAKRKLRLVLGSVGSLPTIPVADVERVGKPDSEREHLIQLLRTLLAEAINGRQQVLSAHIREVIRCLQAFDSKGIRKLLRTLREEHRRRTSYVLYLQQSRLTLLRLISYIDKLTIRIQREKTVAEECLVELLVRFYLENKDQQITKFLQEFAVLNAQDEKTDALSRTLTAMYSRLSTSTMWRDAPESMVSYAKKTLERVMMARIHVIAFYPNLDADRHRDELLFKSLSKLSRAITPDHPMLRIPSVLHGEAPWPSAQAEINVINAYKSARDKLACVVRCCETISNLVSLAPGMGVAAADDITPVLVYVLIQANPPALLSNVQYVQGFGNSLLYGAEGYWWTQFTAAIEFIKTLL